VKRLVLTHLSARYSVNSSELVQQAREVFPETVVARDGFELEIPFAAEE
jgi:ribonuclease Z